MSATKQPPGADSDIETVVNVAHNLVPFYQRGRVMTIAHDDSDRRHRRLYWTQPHSTTGSRPYVFVGRRLSKHREYLTAVEILSRDPLVAVFTTSREKPTAQLPPPYPQFCLHPEKCAGKSCCPRSYSCCE